MIFSKLPWSISGCRAKLSQRNWETDTHTIIDGSKDQNQVAAVFYTDKTDALHAETYGNALMIITAVNNHDELVTRLRVLCDSIEDANMGKGLNHPPHGDVDCIKCELGLQIRHARIFLKEIG